MATDMIIKFCPDCKQNKDRFEFSKANNKTGLYTYCKICANIREKTYREHHKEERAEKDRIWYQNNKEKSLAISKEYHRSHKEEINKRSREYAETNKEKIKAQRATKKDELNAYQKDYARNRCKSDSLFKFKKNIRRSTSEAFSLGKKNKKTLEILGCSLEGAYSYIESLFQPGMTWDNYGSEWHIDHKIPLASANTLVETEELCHYTNLQPLWALDNILKSDKLDWKPSDL